MAYFETYADALAYAADLAGYVLEPVLVCQGSTAFLVGTRRQADLLYVEPTQVLCSVETRAGVN